MLTRLVIAILVTLAPSTVAAATNADQVPAVATPVTTAPSTDPPSSPAPTPPPPTINEFLPVERSLGECISAVPRPGCGSEARGGWHQTLVFLTIFAGLAFIIWRIVAGSRKARRNT